MKKKTQNNDLGEAGLAFFSKTRDEFGLQDAPDLTRLIMAAKILDEIQESEQVVKEEGPFILDRFNQKREHPGVKSIRDNRTLFCRICRDLGLDLDPVPDSRPPRRY